MPSLRAAPVAAPHRIGRYDVVTKLGDGGLATVYLGQSEGPRGYRREVALKVLHPHLRDERELVEALVAEARVVQAIRHPNVVSILDVDEDEQGVFVVMEYVSGAALSTLMRGAARRWGSMPRAVALRIMVDLLRGLHAAHEAEDDEGRPLRLVHRDVSPQNVLVSRKGTARLIDFGIAKFARRELKTRTGLIKGKASYMAPEQARGHDVDRRADVWAAGVVCWELLTGRRLFKSDDEMTTLLEVVTGDVPAVSSVAPVPEALDRVVEVALERDLDRRWASALAFAEALEATGEPLADGSEVAATLGVLLGEELDREEARIASAIESRTTAGPSDAEPLADGDAEGETSTTHAVPSATKTRPRWGLALGAALLVGGGGLWWLGRDEPDEGPASTFAEPEIERRSVMVSADRPLRRLEVNGEPVPLPLAAERVEATVARDAEAIVVVAWSADGERLRQVNDAKAELVRLIFGPIAAPSTTAVASASAAPATTRPTTTPTPAPPRVAPRRRRAEPPVGPSPYGGGR
ncbi:MAG: serine/threonine protein kinase [Myxococcales bacterium]|nr:serine/threonine protein kinase [Myxococcales bacterium]